MSKPLTDKVALVTGGAVRVGRALAEALAAQGARVAVHSRASSSDATLAAIRAAGGEAAGFSADLSDDAALHTLVDRVEASLGPVDILINSAAGFERVAFLQTPAETLDAQWSLNARAPFLLTQRVARGMVARQSGHVVNILDLGGALVPWAGYAAYCMSKAALAMLTLGLALELAPYVRVNGVAPGTVLPPVTLSPAELEALKSRIPLQRFGSPKDVADTVVFLLTGPSFITGQIIAVDGGRLRGMSARQG